MVILSLCVVFSASEDKTVDGFCKPGWEKFENKCYRIFAKETDQIAEMNFQEATAYCLNRQPDSTLITIKSREVQDFITAKLGQLKVRGAVLIGLKRPFRDSRHKWVDGTDLDYENWVEGEPNNSNRNEECAQMEASGRKAGQWNDIPCDVPKRFVCQAEPEFEKKERGEGSCPYIRRLLGKMIDVGSDNCYFLNVGVTSYRDFDNARTACQVLGADLAVFETQQELEQLRPYLTPFEHPYFWVGISSRSRPNGDFRTLEGKPIPPDMWIYGEPNVLDLEKCAAVLGPNAGLYNFRCMYVHNFICQIAKVATDGEVSAPKTCGFDQFRCDNGKCKPAIFRCDFEDDCGDGSDEMDCAYTTTTIKPIAPKTCGFDQFRCDNGKCKPAIFRCDFEDDCGDGSDERDCPYTTTTIKPIESSECTPEQFRCENSSACILLGSRCDGNDDCGDNSDERDCGNTTSIPTVADESTTTEINVIDILRGNDDNNGNENVTDILGGNKDDYYDDNNGNVNITDILGGNNDDNNGNVNITDILGGNNNDNNGNEVVTENDIIDKEKIFDTLYD